MIGFANTLVKAEPKYDGVMAYLLGRVFVVDGIDNAVALAKKSGYSLHIVTLEGEYLTPGGSYGRAAPLRTTVICWEESGRSTIWRKRYPV